MKARFCALQLAWIEPTPPALKGSGFVSLDHSSTVCLDTTDNYLDM
jgi:hypothetical protein